MTPSIATRLGVVAFLALAACSAAPQPPTTPGTTGVTTSIPDVWTWTASTGGPWRLPMRGFGVTVADDGHAIVMSVTGTALVLDLVTGAVGAPVELLPPGDSLDAVVRLGDRLVGFGVALSGEPAAWAITLTPFAATAIAMPDPDHTGPVESGGAVVVSPDRTKVVVCNRVRPPTVRDAQTLAVIATAPGVRCGNPHFSDDDHVVFDTVTVIRELDLGTGAMSDRASDLPEIHAGPGGRTYTQTALDYKLANGSVVVAEGRAAGFGNLRWTPDGAVAVQLATGVLGIYPTTAGAADRRIDLPFGTYKFDVGARTAVVVEDNLVLAIDLADGTIRTAEGNLAPIRKIAPKAGTVIVASNRIRAWRAGTLIATGESQVTSFATDPRGDRTVTLSPDALATWDPTTRRRRVLATLGGQYRSVLARDRDAVVFDDGTALQRSTGGRPPEPWLRYRDGLTVEAVDLTQDRVAFSFADGYRIADLATGTTWTFAVDGVISGCGTGIRLRFEPGSPRFAIDLGARTELFDLASRKRLGGLEMPDLMVYAFDFVPTTGEMILAGAGEVVVWNPATGKALTWTPPIGLTPDTLGIDATGEELAIGYGDGSIVWVNLAGLRAHATPRDPATTLYRSAPTTGCVAQAMAQPTLEELMADQPTE